MSDDAPARLEIILRLPTELDFHQDAVGKSFDTFIGRRAVALTLPRFRWSQDSFRARREPESPVGVVTLGRHAMGTRRAGTVPVPVLVPRPLAYGLERTSWAASTRQTQGVSSPMRR